jgi:hypothetical protein
LDQVVDRALVFRSIENLDRGAANFLVLIVNECDDGIDDPGSADFSERITGAGAYPPVIVLENLQQFLHRVDATDLVENLHRSAARILRFVFQRIGEILDRFGMIDLDHHFDGLVLHVEVGILQ